MRRLLVSEENFSEAQKLFEVHTKISDCIVNYVFSRRHKNVVQL